MVCPLTRLAKRQIPLGLKLHTRVPGTWRLTRVLMLRKGCSTIHSEHASPVAVPAGKTDEHILYAFCHFDILSLINQPHKPEY